MQIPLDVKGNDADLAVVRPARRLHVMLDLETWGIQTNALIVSIGAVKFDPLSDVLQDGFHVGIDPATSFRHFSISPETISWWMEPERRDALDRWRELPKVDILDALDGFSKWFGEESLPVWGNGAAFDNVLLRNAYRIFGLKEPWLFRDDRDMRTLRSLAKDLDLEDIRNTGIVHDALDDARRQARFVQKLLGFIGHAPL